MSKANKKRWSRKDWFRFGWTIVCVIMLLATILFTALPGFSSVSN